MRMDRLTNQLQLALSDAQSLALGKDHNAIDPLHLLSALLEQKNGSVDHLFEHWIRGGGAKDTEPRWSIIRNVLHWVD